MDVYTFSPHADADADANAHLDAGADADMHGDGGQATPVSQLAQSREPVGRNATAAVSSKRFECSAPGCGRHFTRKEHLTRHAKSHNSQFQHQCPICGRRYARSDVLKRHIEFHPQQSSPRRRLVDCVSCHERKARCDRNSPCQSCTQNGVPCLRPGSSQHTAPDSTLTNAGVNGSANLDAGTTTTAGIDGSCYPEDTSVLPDARAGHSDIVGSSWPGSVHHRQSLIHHELPQYDWPLSSLSSLPSTSTLVSPPPLLCETPHQQPLGRWQIVSGGLSPHPRSPDELQTSAAVHDHGFNIVSPDSANPLTPSTSPGRENGSTNQALHRLIREDLPDIPQPRPRVLLKYSSILADPACANL
ncbi:hypothetical protein N656DRAFT_481906 [Canariomyces notabilis]|uniref:Uncharacterized protein n=1 Tax=Canariomyces notabilis TaxID=2074819 RepID=A0AAN6YVB1_9PEZI|nr:hypothetical protein N656DRAFT_481906 [Canariomyces arenarius]